MIRAGVAGIAGLLSIAVWSTAASAQAVPPRPGITVVGTGAVRRPADLARFSLVVSGNGARTPDEALAGADTLVRALKGAGIDDAAIANPMNGLVTAQRFVTITGSMRKPTLEKVRAVVAAASAAVPNNVVLVQNVNIGLALDDCTAAQTDSEAAAMNDARARALRLAHDAAVELGAVSAVSELNLPPSTICPTKPDHVFPANFGNDMLQASAALDVVVTTNLSVTFSIH